MTEAGRTALWAGIGLLAAGALAAGVLASRAPAPPEIPDLDTLPALPRATAEARDVVLVIGCTVRKDELTPYGGLAKTTPFLAELAARGARFEDGIAAAPWTKAATTALITGQHAASVGMVEPTRGTNRRVLASEVTTLAERFAEAGYATVGATANPNLNAVFGMDQGFARYLEGSALWAGGHQAKVDGRVLAGSVIDAVREVPGTAPLFLQVMFVDAHAPTDTPDPSGWAEDGAPQALASYRGDLNRLDTAVRTLSDALTRAGRDPERAYFVFVSDHGEGLGIPTHHGTAHGETTYRSTVAMPWLVTGPDVASRTIPGLASQVDVTPTLLGLADIEGYEGPGQDHSALIRGEGQRTARDRAFVDTWFAERQRAAVYTDDTACHLELQKTEDTTPGRVFPACYDRRTDPWAEHPLADPPRALIKEAWQWRKDRESEYAAWPHTRNAKLDDDETRMLEALGYVQ
ncbi:MAG: hypothetical protein EP330_04635 [Deltaproteobacteria bacterium]|nr:MAG: hypothetical protein EP330_04635 [Deltaproteobacteria bacterium]